jgi:indole-3-acetate monooxygenase
MRADLDSNVEADMVAAARRLLSQLVGTREEAERVRHLSPALGDTLADAGLYRLYLPRAVGGLELPPATAFEVIEVLSKADGSVGWCVMNANAVALGAGWLAPEVGQRPFFMGKPPVGSGQALNLAFLINRQDNGMRRRSDVRSDDVEQLAANLGSLDSLN